MSAACSYIIVWSTAGGVRMIQEEYEKGLAENSAQHYHFLLKFNESESVFPRAIITFCGLGFPTKIESTSIACGPSSIITITCGPPPQRLDNPAFNGHDVY